MAINTAIIRIRRGLKDELQIDKLLPGELAMATDAPIMWFCWAPGSVEQVPTSENITEIIAEIIKEYLKDNPVTGISEIYMRVANGFIQYSSDNETWNNLLAIEDISGSGGNDGYSPSVDISKDGKTTTITITDKNGEHTATINDGVDGKDGKDGKTAYQYAQDGGYTGTEAQFSQKLAKEYPSKTSELKNDSGFITKAASDLANYYLKSETYSQSEINQRLSAIPKFAIQVVTSLPLSGDSTTVYLLKSGDSEPNLYTEYIYVDGKWEYLGSQTVDLSGYAKKATTLLGYGITDGATKEQFNQLSNEKADQSNWTPNMIIGTDANGNMVARETYTEDEKQALMDEIIDSIRVEMPESHVIYGDVDENNNIVIFGELPDGEYKLKYENEDGNVIEIGSLVLGGITNLANPSSAEWVEKRRINSSNSIVEAYDGSVVANFIPCKNGDVVRVKGIDIAYYQAGPNDGGRTNMFYYKSDKSTVVNKIVVADNPSIFVNSGDTWTFTVGNGVSGDTSTIAYIRPFGRYMSGYTKNDVIITVNEEIK